MSCSDETLVELVGKYSCQMSVATPDAKRCRPMLQEPDIIRICSFHARSSPVRTMVRLVLLTRDTDTLYRSTDMTNWAMYYLLCYSLSLQIYLDTNLELLNDLT